MNIKGTNIYIMWKEIAIIFFVMYAARVCIDLYIVKVYNKLASKLFSMKWDGLEKEMVKHRRLCDFLSNGPWNKGNRLIYNNLCVLLASMGLMKNDEGEFVNQLNMVKKETEFELKPFMLALYYCSKQNSVLARKNYDSYLQCNRDNKEIKIIMEYLFCEEERQKKVEFNDVIKKFKNPAIIKLIKDNNLLGKSS